MPSLPQPYSNKSVPEWIAELQTSEIAEDRLRALQAIGLLASKNEASKCAAHSLTDADSTVRALAAKLLGANSTPMSAQTEVALAALLEDPDPDARFESARALIRSRSQQNARSIPVLLKFLDEEETQPLMIAAVMNVLIEADPIAGLTAADLHPRIERFLDHERAEVREAISAAIAKWPTLCESLGDRLLVWLDDSEPVVRENIALAFGRAGILNDSIRAGLQTASQDEDSEVARVASEALQKLGG